MKFLERFDLTPAKIFKTLGFGVLGLIALFFVINLLGANWGGMINGGSLSGIRSMGSSGVMGMSASAPMAYQDLSFGGYESAKLSTRNVAPQPYGQSVGDTAEDYEATDYGATIETRGKAPVCDAVRALKALPYVVFQSVSESDTSCSFSFKVAHEKVGEVLAAVKALNPKELTQNTYTIKKQIDDFTSETEILLKKRKSIDDTLASAIRAYDEITDLATQSKDAASLARIIESRIQIIERLTQERVNINAQLERLERAKGEQLDRLAYTYFSVYVYESKFVDSEQIADSWRNELRAFVTAINVSLQRAIIGVINFAVGLVPLALYALILVFVAKYGWRLVKGIWEK